MTWTDAAAQYVLRSTSCPRCDTDPLDNGVCSYCGADLNGRPGAEVWEASQQVAAALRARQLLVDALPVVRPSAIATAARAPQNTAELPAPTSTVDAAPSVTLQSVLAVAGAGLMGVAAIVFTFLNPELTDFATRTTIIAVVTAAMMGFAWLLAHRQLRFSAESVGALGVVFLILDVWALTSAGDVMALAAVGTFVSAVLLIGAATAARIRTWLWAGIVGLAITPALVGYSVGGTWPILAGQLAAGFVALATHQLLRRTSTRFGSGLRADHGTLTLLQVATVVIVIAQLTIVDGTATVRAIGTAIVLGMLALLSVLASRQSLPRFWGFAAGALSVAAVAALPFALPVQVGWYLALVPLAAVAGLVAVSTVTGRATARAGALLVAAACSVPSAAVSLWGLLFSVAGRTESAPQDVDVTNALAAILGLAALTIGLLLSRGTLARGSRSRRAALWLAMYVLVAASAWVGWPRPASIVIALAVATALGALTVAWRPRTNLLVPVVIGAHALVVTAALLSVVDGATMVLSGIAVVAVLGLLSRTVVTELRPLLVAIAYGYALVIFARALALVEIDVIAILCLTTSLAAICALIVTLARRVRTGYWYAVLVVTAVPFAIGIISVLIERSGWTALSTGLIFLLSLTLVVTRRPGLTRSLRALAAGLLIPALAVVIISLGAQVLSMSASPITLPVIAAIVAVTLPSTGLIGAALVRRGIADDHARVARIAIEVSSLVTAAVAVLLALVRAAAGLQTSFLVLMIIGIGAAAAGAFLRRRYAWVVAAASFTGAMWCVWALIGVTVVEPYLLPPALAAAVVGAIATARGLPARPLFSTGLAAALLPSLVILAAFGSTATAGIPWRSLALLAAAVVLIVAALLFNRAAALRPLVTAALVGAIAATCAGAIQAVRYGVGADELAMANPQLVMLPVLAFSAVASLLAAVAARAIARRVTWTPRVRAAYVPALVLLVVGPIAGIRAGWLPILTLLALSVGLLLLMLMTVVRARSRQVTLPPVWVTFALAWCTAVAGWSERELRVEAFSLPLGFALLLAGIIASVRGHDQVLAPPEKAGWTSWPFGFAGSWWLLAPGIVMTLLPSILATGTDPLTHRAILVIALALISILIGSLRKLAAPFILGIIALPIENIVVFAVQIGRSIGALPWWITLATAGAVLLVIAVSSERRVSGDRGVAARLRDLT